MAFVDRTIGESVGRVYVARFFPPEAKAKMDALVADIQTALKARILGLDWMAFRTEFRGLRPGSNSRWNLWLQQNF